MANGAVLYTTASRTPRKGEVHRGGCGCDARTPFPRRNDRVAARHGRMRGVERAADADALRKSDAATRWARRRGYGRRTEGWMSESAPANCGGLTTRPPARL